jgi:hypothetical protein
LINHAAAGAGTNAPFLINGMVRRRSLSPGKEKYMVFPFDFRRKN